MKGSPQQGFQQWWGDPDKSFDTWDAQSPLTSKQVVQMLRGVTCRAECWFRYVQWHNLAILETTRRRKLPVYMLHYEMYGTNFDGMVKKLFGFLELPIVNDPLPFISAGKTYGNHYHPSDFFRRKAVLFVRVLASRDETWLLVRQDFEDSLNAAELDM
jgi:hypothetical protein